MSTYRLEIFVSGEGYRCGRIEGRSLVVLSASRNTFTSMKDFDDRGISSFPACTYVLQLGQYGHGHSIYVGQSDRNNILKRLSGHLATPDKSWENAAVIIPYVDRTSLLLESRLIASFRDAGDKKIVNVQIPGALPTNQAERHSLDDTFQSLRIISEAMGLTHLFPDSVIPDPPASTPPQNTRVEHAQLYHIHAAGIKASGYITTGNKMVVLSGSQAALRFAAGNDGYRNVFESMESRGFWRKSSGHHVFIKDVVFSSRIRGVCDFGRESIV